MTSAAPKRTLLPPALLAVLILVVLVSAAAAAPAPWGPPTGLGDTGRAAIAPKPELAVDAAGEAVAVWERRDRGEAAIEAAARLPGGEWSAPIAISGKGDEVGEPEVAISPAGRAVVVWQRSAGADTIVESASRPARGRWSRPLALSRKGGRAAVPRVALDAVGDAFAVWQRYDGEATVIQSSSARVGRRWSAPEDLSPEGRDALGPQIAVDPTGNAVAIWRLIHGFGAAVQAASRPPGGRWSAPRAVSAKGEETFVPQVAAGGGEAVVLWESSDGVARSVRGAWRTATGPWSRPTVLSGRGEGSAPAIAIDPAGEAVAVWEGKAGRTVIESSARPAGGAFSPPVALSAKGPNALKPGVALDSAGEAVAVWQRFAGKGFTIESAARPPGCSLVCPEQPVGAREVRHRCPGGPHRHR